MHVLIAHPDAEIRGRMREWLEPCDYEVHDVGDAAAVRAAMRRASYDVALIAADLPGADTRALLTEIKRGPRGHGTAIVLIDRSLDFDAAMADLRRGAHDFLIEPLNPAELVARVQSAARMASLQEELLRQSRRLEALVYQDALTGLHNRRFMLSQLAAVVSSARRHGRPLTVVMIDLDHFKALNDRHGHGTGDRALVAVARALRERLRTEDYVGRLGGEEFLAILPDTGAADGAAVAEALRACAALEIRGPDGEPVPVTASVGWATWSGDSPEELVRRADSALYEAKAAGRDLVRGG